MKTRKLLLADASPEFCAALTRALIGSFEVRTCRDGLQAQAMLEEFCPDILVTDLALPGLDGVSLLRAAASKTKRPALLVTTRYTSAYVENVIGQIGVDYMMLKPCDIRALAERIHDLTQSDSEIVTQPAPRTAVCGILLALGLQVGRRGYSYLEAIIEMYRQDPGRSLTKDLYPTAGRLHQANGAAVERAVRGVIETAWDNRDEALWRQYFPVGRGGYVPKPTNRAFIAAVAMALEGQQQRFA